MFINSNNTRNQVFLEMPNFELNFETFRYLSQNCIYFQLNLLNKTLNLHHCAVGNHRLNNKRVTALARVFMLRDSVVLISFDRDLERIGKLKMACH